MLSQECKTAKKSFFTWAANWATQGTVEEVSIKYQIDLCDNRKFFVSVLFQISSKL